MGDSEFRNTCRKFLGQRGKEGSVEVGGWRESASLQEASGAFWTSSSLFPILCFLPISIHFPLVAFVSLPLAVVTSGAAHRGWEGPVLWHQEDLGSFNFDVGRQIG